MKALAWHEDNAGVSVRGLHLDDEAQMFDLRREVLPTLTVERALSMYVVLVAHASGFKGWDFEWGGRGLLANLRRRALPWTVEDVQLLLDLADKTRPAMVLTVLRAAGDAAERLAAADRAACLTQLRQAIQLVDRAGYDQSEKARVRLRLRTLIESADQSAQPRVRTAVLHVQDGWSRAAEARLLAVTVEVDAVNEVLAHAAAIPAGPRPSKAWLSRAHDLIAGRTPVVDLLHDLLDSAATCEPADAEAWHELYQFRVSADNADLLRGLLWTAMVVEAPWLVPLAEAVYGGVDEVKVRNTCFAVLGRRADAEAIAALLRLQREARDRGELTQIAAALDEAAGAAGITRSELTEQTIPDAGLDRGRQRRFTEGDVSAVLALDDRARVSVSWERGGIRSARPPAEAGEGLVRQVKRAAAELKQLVAGERDRLEDLLTEDREWPLATWRERYADHPVTGSLANRLLWTLIDAGRHVAALPGPDDRFTLSDGGTSAPGPDARVRVWHPALADPEQVRAWRAHILDRELLQPFKQAFREVYLLTPAEEETRVYSNRFGGHVLRYQQTYALMKERRWVTNYLGGWDGGYDGEAKRDFPGHGLRAVFLHTNADGGTVEQVRFCTTDQVRFQRRQGRAWEAVPLVDVPTAVFSEAMRDVDLFVGVASIATDPTWSDRGTEPQFRYWQDAAFGKLSAYGQTRRQVLEHLLPKLKIRDRARIEGNYLVVDGRKHTYRIHIGSANILMSPNDQYLCIVPARGARATGVRFVPFEGDGLLAVVLSKALLLADDHRITDPSIVAQIG